MARTINNELITEVIEKTDLVDLISQDIDMIKKGANFVGLCPFHDDNNPSFTISPEKKIYKCFVCQEGGNALTYMQKKRKLSFKESIAYLSQQIGIEVISEPELKKEKIHFVNEDATTFYKTILLSTDHGQGCLTYLNIRKYDDSLIDIFELGFAPSDNYLLKYLTKKSQEEKKYSEFDILNSNLLTDKYEFFSNRLVVPIRDYDNRVVGFSGRIISGEGVKYINSKDSSIFSKKHVLYNLNRAKKYINDGTLIIVEGFFDVFALQKLDINNVVALMGTALTIDHIKLLKRARVKKIIMLLDQDQAGIDSTIKSSSLILRTLTPNVRVCTFDGYKDVDELITNKGSVEEYLKVATNYIEFKLKYLIKKISIDSLEDKTNFINEFKSEIRLYSNDMQLIVTNEIANHLKMTSADVSTLLNIEKPKLQEVKSNLIEVVSSFSDYDDYFSPQANEYTNDIKDQVDKPLDAKIIDPVNIEINNNYPRIEFKLTQEDSAIAFSLKSRENFVIIKKGYESGNIQFKVYKNLFHSIVDYYASNKEMDLVDFTDSPETSDYFTICRHLMTNILLDDTKISEVSATPNLNKLPGRSIFRATKKK